MANYTTRTTDWVIQKAFLHAQRKATMPTSGSAKYNALLGIADSMQKLWASEPGIEWESLYSWVTLPTTITTTDTYALDPSIQYLSKREGDYIRVTDGTVNNTKSFKLVSPNELYEYRNSDAVAQVGRNLKFSRVFDASESIIGYSIIVPAITVVSDLTTGSSIVQVDDPMWLAYMMAADFNRNDPLRVGQYENLINLAENVMSKMKEDNEGTFEDIPRDVFVTGETWR